MITIAASLIDNNRYPMNPTPSTQRKTDRPTGSRPGQTRPPPTTLRGIPTDRPRPRPRRPKPPAAGPIQPPPLRPRSPNPIPRRGSPSQLLRSSPLALESRSAPFSSFIRTSKRVGRKKTGRKKVLDQREIHLPALSPTAWLLALGPAVQLAATVAVDGMAQWEWEWEL